MKGTAISINSRSYQKVNPEEVLISQEKFLKEAWAEFIEEYTWEWWVSLTFRDKVSTKTANRKWNKWLKALEKELEDQVGYFRVTELQRPRNCLHFHALMLNLKGARRLTWMDRWDLIAGYARIFPYEKSKGANHYLCKYVTKQIAEHKFGGCILKT